MPRKKKTQDNFETSLPDFEGKPLESDEAEKQQASAKLKYSVDSRRLKKRLADIYAEVKEENSLAESRRGASRKVKILTFSVFILAFLAGVSWLGFFFFEGGKKFSEENIKLAVDGSDKIYSGETVTYRLKYGNQGGLPLGMTALSVRYPEGFKIISSTPALEETSGNEWAIGSLGPGKEGEVEITGRFAGAANTDLTLRVFLDYRPANFNADFQKIVNFKIHSVPLPLEMTLTGPDQMMSGEQSGFALVVNNNTEEEFKDLELAFAWPTGFKAEAFSPATSGTTAVWSIASLLPHTSSTVRFKGSFTADAEGGEKTLKAIISSRDGDKVFSQNVFEKKISISQAALFLQVAANGAIDKQAINFGDKVIIAVNYENTGQITLKNMTLRLVLDTPSVDKKSLFDWAAIEDKISGTIKGEQKSDTIRRGIVSWNKSQIPALAEIKPGAKGTVELSLPVKKSDALDIKRLAEFKTIVYAEALAGQAIPTGGQANNNQPAGIQSNNLSLLLNSDLALSLQATFRETKNLPVQISQKYDVKSIYTVTWTLTNKLHEVTDLELAATLPENVDWENITSISAGEINYDENLKQVIWKLNRMPDSYNKATVSFDVGLKAEGEDRGREAVLIEKTRVQASDKLTGENILFWKDPVVTIL